MHKSPVGAPPPGGPSPSSDASAFSVVVQLKLADRSDCLAALVADFAVSLWSLTCFGRC